jgi:hypothetical protein
MSTSAAAEAHLAQLLRMLAGLEEAIIRLEARGGNSERLVARLRLVQGDIEAAIKRLGDPGRSEPRPGSS